MGGHPGAGLGCLEGGNGDGRCYPDSMIRLCILLFTGVTVLAGCSVAGDSIPTLVSPTSAPGAIDIPREVIGLSISLFLLVDDKEEPDPEISTHRTEEDLREILEGMNDIWGQAGIRLELRTIETVEVLPRDGLHLAVAPLVLSVGQPVALGLQLFQ